MAKLPALAPGVLLSGPDTAIAQDLVAETLHRLNASALALLDACDGDTEVDELAAEWSDLTGADPAEVRRDILKAVESFSGLGLVGRTDPAPTPRRLGQASDTESFPVEGAIHPVVGHAIQFVGSDPDLVRFVDDYLGPGTVKGEPTRRFTIEERADGSVRLVADSEWVFPDRSSLLDQVTTVVNEYGHENGTFVTLHSAGLVRPDGSVVILPAVSGAGKSTLAGLLVAAGWGYLGDESIGIRGTDLAAVPYPKPLALDASSRSALGLDPSDRWNTTPRELNANAVVHVTAPGPVDIVVLPTYEPGATWSLERLSPTDALESLITNTLNLSATGQAGMDTLDDVATTVPTFRLVHGGGPDIVARLSEITP
ncbi:MAG: PqqD family peptide modification chaperone [Acidimicrobiales bacterium]|nr:PqqD family peptide modification chaperone [Acidimicrobiales bacterium]